MIQLDMTHLRPRAGFDSGPKRWLSATDAKINQFAMDSAQIIQVGNSGYHVYRKLSRIKGSEVLNSLTSPYLPMQGSSFCIDHKAYETTVPNNSHITSGNMIRC
jgi:hypothetical protein